MARIAVVVFPGSNCDQDVWHALVDVLGQQAEYVWHQETSLEDFDAVILPGGFSYGDYLRPGAIARFSPVMEAVAREAARGKPVIGICNGFQILCEAGLLPGALRRNRGLRFLCRPVYVRVENPRTPLTWGLSPGRVLRLEIAHGEGSFYAPPPVREELERRGQVVLRYCDPQGRLTPEANPNGSEAHIAGICNPEGNVVGLMPHPERCVEPLLGSQDGRLLLEALVRWIQERGRAGREEASARAGPAVDTRPSMEAVLRRQEEVAPATGLTSSPARAGQR